MLVMDIFPNELRQSLPPLQSQEGVSDPIVHLKFFTPDGNWIWYVIEGSPADDDFLFFGFVIGLEEEWGHFWLSQLSESRGPSGFPVERDLRFQPEHFSGIMSKKHGLAAPLK